MVTTALELFSGQKHLPNYSNNLLGLNPRVTILLISYLWFNCDAHSFNTALFYSPLYCSPLALSIYLSLFAHTCTRWIVHHFSRSPVPSTIDAVSSSKINATLDPFCLSVSLRFRGCRPFYFRPSESASFYNP